MRPRREAKPPRRPRVVTWRLVLVSLIVGILLAVGSVPVGVAVDRMPWPSTERSTSARTLVFDHRRINAYGVHSPAFDARSYRQWSELAHLAGTPPLDAHAYVAVDRDPRPRRARRWLERGGREVTVGEAGWPLRAAEWQHRASPFQGGRSAGATTAHNVGAWHVPAVHGEWPIPYLPLWPGLLGNTLFYAALMLTPLALWRYRKLRRRAWRGMCVACGYELGEGVGACPECGLDSRGS